MGALVVIGYPVDPVKRRELEQEVGRPLPMYSGSTKHPCSDCGLELWIAPRSMSVVDKGLADALCIKCAAAFSLQSGGATLTNLGNPEWPFKDG